MSIFKHDYILKLSLFCLIKIYNYGANRVKMAEKGGLLARSEFPLYVVKALDERHFLVAGGGGAAKTGIANAIVSRLRCPLEDL